MNNNRWEKCIAWLLILVLLSGIPETVYAEISTNFASRSENVLNESVSENSESGEVSENQVVIVSENIVSKNDISENEVSSNIVSENKVGVQSGIWHGLSWSINDEGVLYITGTATESTAIEKREDIPWHNCNISVKSVIVNNCLGVDSTADWFSGFCEMESADLSGLDTSQVTDMGEMFAYCVKLSSLDVSHFNTNHVSNMCGMFYDCEKLSSLDISHFDTSQVTDMSTMFALCGHLSSLDVSHLDTSQVTNMNSLFSGCEELSSLDVSHFNTSYVTDMCDMFYSCRELSSLNVSYFNTSKVTNMRGMFFYCIQLSSLDVSQLDTSKVTDMYGMFSGCSKLNSLDVSHFNTSQVTDMHCMFSGCTKLNSLDVSHFDTSQVTNMYCMFSGCTKLNSLDVSHFDTSQVTNMREMFCFVSSVSELDLSGCSLKSISNCNDVFRNCQFSTLKTPTHVSYDIDLPYKMYDDYGTEYEFLPKNTTVSITLTRNMPVAINANGQAYCKVQILDDDNHTLANQEISCIFDGYNYSYQTKTDSDGYALIRTPKLKNSTNKNMVILFITKIYKKNGNDLILLRNNPQFKVIVEPLSFSQSWKAVSKQSLELKFPNGKENGIKNTDLEASLMELSTTGTLGGSLEMNHDYNKGKRTLKLNQTYTANIAGKCTTGLGKKAAIANNLSKINISSGGGKIANGINVSAGLKIDDYDPDNADQVLEMGKYLVGAYGNSTGNAAIIMLLDKLGFDYSNTNGCSYSFQLDKNVDAGGLTFKNSAGSNCGIGSLYSINTSRTLTNGMENDETNHTTIMKHSSVVETGQNIGELTGHISSSIFSKDFGGSRQITAKIDNNTGKVIETGFKGIKSSSSGVLFQSTTSNDITDYKFDAYETKKIKDNCNYYDQFSNTALDILNDSAVDDMLNTISGKNICGTYTNEVGNEKMVEFKLPLQLNKVTKYTCDLQGIENLEYETERGNYIDDKKEVTSTCDIKSFVDEKKVAPTDILANAVSAVGNSFINFLKEVTGNISSGLKAAGATVKGVIGSTLKWKIHIKYFDPTQSKIASSYDIATFADENVVGERAGISSTVGNPYIFYVTNENDQEIENLEEQPLTISLAYTDADMLAAGATLTDASSLAIYRFSEEKSGYIYQGGTVDTTNQTVSVDILIPGQYILAIDTVAPQISNVYVSDAGDTPIIYANISELNDFGSFSMKIDEVEHINTENLAQFYDTADGILAYRVTSPLKEGEHTVSIFASDAVGNAMSSPENYTFIIDLSGPKIEEVKTKVNKKDLNIRATIIDKDIRRVTAEITEQLKDGTTVSGNCELKLASDKYEGNYSLHDTVSVAFLKIHAWDENGNVSKSDTITVHLGSYNFFRDEKEASKELGGAKLAGYITPTLTRNSFVYCGKEIRPVVSIKYTYTPYGDSKERSGKAKTVKLVENRDYTVSYEDNIVVGTGTIILQGIGDYTGSYNVHFSIIPKSIKKAKIEPIADWSSSGDGKEITEEIKKEIVVKDGVDTISDNNLCISFLVNGLKQESLYDSKQIQKVTVLISGRNNYKYDIQKTQTFIVYPEDGSKKSIENNIIVTFKKVNHSYIYSGKENNPAVIVNDRNGKKISNKNYKVIYLDNVNSGTATVKVIGKNEYCGSKKMTYEIYTRNLDKVKVKSLSNVFLSDTIENMKPSVMYGGSYLKEGKDYTIDATNTREISLLGLKCKKVTYVLNAVKESNYSGKITVNFMVFPRNINNSMCVQAYCDDVQLTDPLQGAMPVPFLYDNGKELILNSDYKIKSYNNNHKVGKGKVIVEGIGNYRGKRTIKFNIKPK